MSSSEEKTEQATPKKMQQMREKGSVPKSQDFSTALMLLFGSLIIFYIGGPLVSNTKETMIMIFSNLFIEELNPNTLHILLINVFIKNLNGLVPVLGGFMVIGVIGSYSQVGFLFSPKALMPDFKKLNPITGIKGLVSRKSLVKLVMSIVKLIIMTIVTFFSVKSDIAPLMELITMNVEGIFISASHLIFAITIKISIILLILAILDLMYQRWQYAKDAKMGKNEVKQESKQQEGDPLVKSRIRGVQRELANKRMMSDVPEADVVISNPTHYAVALKYDTMNMDAPKVVAKGLDFVALKIIGIAKENNVPVVEDRILVRILHSTVEIGDEIPPKLFQAVAKVLSYIYQLKNIARV